MIKLGAVAIIAFILVLLGSCQLYRCACGGRTVYTWHCVKRDDPKIKCPGLYKSENKKSSPDNCHDLPMLPDFKYPQGARKAAPSTRVRRRPNR